VSEVTQSKHHDIQPQGEPAPPAGGGSSMKRDAVVVLVVIIAIAAMLIGGKYLSKSGAGKLSNQVGAKGSEAPDFELADLQGKPVRLSELRGRAVLLNFWATWCAPCKIEIPWFVDLQKQYGPQGLQIVGVAVDVDNKDDVAKFAREMGINYPVLLGNDRVSAQYGGVEALPTSYYIGRDGKVVTRVFGLVSHSEVEANIKAALKQGQSVAAAGAGQ